MSCDFQSLTINNPSFYPRDIAVIEAVSTSPVEQITCFTNGNLVCKYLIGGGNQEQSRRELGDRCDPFEVRSLIETHQRGRAVTCAHNTDPTV